MTKRSKRSVRGKQPKLHPASVRFDATSRPKSKIPENTERGAPKGRSTKAQPKIERSSSPSPPRSGGEGRGEVVLKVQGEEKTSAVQLLQSTIAARRKSQTELSNLSKWLADKSAHQKALETTGDLNDSAVLTEIGRLQIFTALLPRRIVAKEEDDLKAEQTLIDAANQFIREHLGPRIQRLAAQTRVIVETELSSHYRDPAARIVAVAKSERVRTVESLAWPASVAPPRGAIAHAEAALHAWAAADKFENQTESTLR